MQRKKILLINPPFFAASDLFRDTITPPINLGYLISSLKGCGLDIEVLDIGLECVKKFGINKNNYFLEQSIISQPKKEQLLFIRKLISDKLETKDFFIAAINGDLFRIAFYCLREAKKVDPDIITIVGGHVSSKCYGAFLDKKQVDFVLIDEAEGSFRNLVGCLLKKGDVHEVNGIVFKESGSYIKTPHVKDPDIKKIPYPDFALFDIREYLKLNGNRLMVLSSRGCRSLCKFCGRSLNPCIRVRDAKDVVDEIESLMRMYGVKRFSFFNAMMNITPNHITDICNEIINRKLDIGFASYLKADRFLDEETFKLLKKAGCYVVHFGIESGSQKVLDMCNKGINIKKAIEIVKMCKKAGIKVRCSFVWDFPFENWIDFIKSLFAYLRIRPHCCGFYELYLEENSEFYNNIENYTSLYSEGPISIWPIKNKLATRVKRAITNFIQNHWDEKHPI